LPISLPSLVSVDPPSAAAEEVDSPQAIGMNNVVSSESVQYLPCIAT
jgi:hypothetical protein